MATLVAELAVSEEEFLESGIVRLSAVISLARLAGCRVACYTHYPMISRDMLARVAARRPSYNNDAAVANSRARALA